ncbi:hypothetical protein V3C99_018168, partial [Haemonchus contortus]
MESGHKLKETSIVHFAAFVLTLFPARTL